MMSNVSTISLELYISNLVVFVQGGGGGGYYWKGYPVTHDITLKTLYRKLHELHI